MTQLVSLAFFMCHSWSVSFAHDFVYVYQIIADVTLVNQVANAGKDHRYSTPVESSRHEARSPPPLLLLLLLRCRQPIAEQRPSQREQLLVFQLPRTALCTPPTATTCVKIEQSVYGECMLTLSDFRDIKNKICTVKELYYVERLLQNHSTLFENWCNAVEGSDTDFRGTAD